jgi:hypothetical protein
MRADVSHGKVILRQAAPGGKIAVSRARGVTTEIHTIDDDLNFPAVNAPARQILFE